MFSAVKRVAAPAVLKGITWWLSRYHYEVVKKPPSLFRRPSAELKVTFDLILADYARRTPDVCFVQIGGFDGRSGDPLYPFITDLHWKGVIVEPQPDAFEALSATYAAEPQVRLENAALANREGTRTLWRIRRGVSGLPGWAPQLASFDRDQILRHRAQIPNIEALLEGIDVPCITLDAVLTRSGLPKLDVLQIDVEGFDFEVVKMVDFTRHRPAIVRYEHAHLSADDREACIALLVEQGYRIAIEAYDTIACATPSSTAS